MAINLEYHHLGRQDPSVGAALIAEHVLVNLGVELGKSKLILLRTSPVVHFIFEALLNGSVVVVAVALLPGPYGKDFQNTVYQRITQTKKNKILPVGILTGDERQDNVGIIGLIDRHSNLAQTVAVVLATALGLHEAVLKRKGDTFKEIYY